ncbi:hypothetical protein J3R82DRAFT_8879 [Butyriboletus roseoflavus]|nr:hypothetical protein J3R82DRAFT_8879 [Butyriboletus roseoflavus]
MPKTMKEHVKTNEFCQFCNQLLHLSLLLILQSLKPFMTTLDIVHFGDGHYCHIIYGLGPYIANYGEQVLLILYDFDIDALYHCQEYIELLLTQLSELFGLGQLWDEYDIVGELVPFTNDFPCADIYDLLALDLLHQIIKGAFKDHFVD